MPHPFNINQPAPGPGLFVDKPRPFPTLPGITEQRNGASHTYQALNMEVERRLVKGLMFQSGFSWLKDIGGSGVNMDVRFVLPEGLKTRIDGRMLTASAGPRSHALIVTVLHPRSADAPPATSELISVRESRIGLRIGAGGRRMTVELDLARRRPSLTEL